jgi:hypothetical protein
VLHALWNCAFTRRCVRGGAQAHRVEICSAAMNDQWLLPLIEKRGSAAARGRGFTALQAQACEQRSRCKTLESNY